MGFGPTYVAHIPPLEGWYSRDSLCYGVGARVVYIAAFAFAFFCFCSYISHTRPDPITKRISAVPPFKWRDVSHAIIK